MEFWYGDVAVEQGGVSGVVPVVNGIERDELTGMLVGTASVKVIVITPLELVEVSEILYEIRDTIKQWVDTDLLMVVMIDEGVRMVELKVLELIRVVEDAIVVEGVGSMLEMEGSSYGVLAISLELENVWDGYLGITRLGSPTI